MNLPSFLIIGAAKTGTTSLYSWLKQHPQVYMTPVKETNFFAFEGENLDFPPGTVNEKYLANCKTNIESYCEQFKGVTNEIAIGEASPIYLYNPKAAERILHYIPNAKLIVILRNPIERAYSNFLHHIREGYEPLSDFNEAIQEEKNRIDKNWWWGFHYIQVGFYYNQLKQYFNRFDTSQIKVYLYEDLKNTPVDVIRDIFKFIDVDDKFIPDMSLKYNVTGIPNNKVLHHFLSKPNLVKSALKQVIPVNLIQHLTVNVSNHNLTKPSLNPEIKKQLIQKYRDDVLKVQELIKCDLSIWLEF